MTLRPRVRQELERCGIRIEPQDTPAGLRERLNDAYLEEVRALRSRRVSGEIPAARYADAVRELRDRFPLLGLPVGMWEDDAE